MRRRDLPRKSGTAITITVPLMVAVGLLAVMTRSVAASSSTRWVLGASGTSLTLNGVKHDFVGVDAYEIATEWGTNAGCGSELSDVQMNEFFASLPADSLVRIWAFQGTMATDISNGQLDWQPLDRVFNAAAAHNQHLIVAISDQAGTCDGQTWQNPRWYEGGFRQVQDLRTINGTRLTPLSYWRYMQALVEHFRNNPALAMWEPMSEAEASTCPPRYEPTNCTGHQICPNEHLAAVALRYFFDVVGRKIHQLDPAHLVESGLLGGGQCGTSDNDFEFVNASPGIDVASIHVYCIPMRIMCGDRWNGESLRFRQTAALNKPLIIGEEGIQAGSDVQGCPTFKQRAKLISSKAKAEFNRGSAAILLWDWVPTTQGVCSYNITSDDPAFRDLTLLAHEIDATR